MTATELANMCNVSKREIDYWSNLGLIRFIVNEQNSYRIYNEKSVEDVNLILMAIKAGLGSSLTENVGLLKAMIGFEGGRKIIKDAIQKNKEKSIKQYDNAISMVDYFGRED